MFDMKTQYDESDNVMVRATRTFTDKFSELFGMYKFTVLGNDWFDIGKSCFRYYFKLLHKLISLLLFSTGIDHQWGI